MDEDEMFDYRQLSEYDSISCYKKHGHPGRIHYLTIQPR